MNWDKYSNREDVGYAEKKNNHNNNINQAFHIQGQSYQQFSFSGKSIIFFM